jgi:hypothetical protein
MHGVHELQGEAIVLGGFFSIFHLSIVDVSEPNVGAIVVYLAQEAPMIDVDSAVDIFAASLHQGQIVEGRAVAIGCFKRSRE